MTRVAAGALCCGLLAASSCAQPATAPSVAFTPGQSVRYVLDVVVDGRRVATPTVTLAHGETADLTVGAGDGTLTASIRADGRVSLHVPVREEHGWVAAPPVLLRANETAELHFRGRAAQHHLRVACTAEAL